jgi:hypothetical protein
MRRITALLLALSALVFTLAPVTAEAKPRSVEPQIVPVTSTSNFVGQYAVTKFVVDDGVLYAVATLTGKLAGKAIPPTMVNVPVDTDASGGGSAGALAAAAAPACDILNLVLGPLDLNILGLEIHLDQVVLDIVAQPGAGQLLGNLLCAVAGLLDGPSPLAGALNGIAALLNRILSILG